MSLPRALGKAVTLLLFAVAFVLAVALSGCGPLKGGTRPPEGDPVPLAQCEQACYDPCVTDTGRKDAKGRPIYDVEGIRWEGDPNDPASTDALATLVLRPLVERLIGCETHRKACHQCLLRLDNAGAVKLP